MSKRFQIVLRKPVTTTKRRRRRMALRAKVMITVILTKSKKGGYAHISKYLPIILDDCCVGSWELLLRFSC
jgi:hypothetical protein